MDIMTILIGASATVIGLMLGVIFGAMPLQTEKMSEGHRRCSQLLSIVGFGMVMALMIVKMDVASWTVIAAMLAGLVTVKIPPLHRWIVARIPWFAPVSHDSASSKRNEFH